MNKLILVIAVLAVYIPSAFSVGESCTNDRACLNNSNTTCCVKGTDGNKSCQTVTGALLTTAFDTASKLSVAAGFLTGLKPTIDGLANGVPLTLDPRICFLYGLVQNAINTATKLVPGVL